jgi:Na+/proline symporter
MSEPFRWTERRTARLATVLVAAAVVVADIVLFLVFAGTAKALPGGWTAYWYIPAGILAVLLFALRRLIVQLRLFREDR